MRVFDCGCVEGQYWCSKHDIYAEQKIDDLPPHGSHTGWGHAEAATKSVLVHGTPEGCSCHVSAPCSYCTREVPDDN